MFTKLVGSDKIRYSKEFLLSELHRFYTEFGTVPTSHMMTGLLGYPSYKTYLRYFGSWRNVLELSKLIDKTLPLSQFQCPVCFHVLPIEFRNNTNGHCRDCVNEYSRTWYKNRHKTLLYKQERASAILHQILKQSNDNKRNLQTV